MNIFFLFQTPFDLDAALEGGQGPDNADQDEKVRL
jgi:hypothetical protein